MLIITRITYNNAAAIVSPNVEQLNISQSNITTVKDNDNGYSPKIQK